MKNLELRLDASGDSADLYIYEAIEQQSRGGSVTPRDVADTLKQAANVSTINVRINSPGGDVFAGFAIYNLLANSGKKITVDVDGIAASAASVIAMAGTVRRMAATSQMMIHEGYSGNGGTEAELRKKADLLRKINDQISNVYASATRQPVASIKKMMSDETWMDPEQALKLGFATEIVKGKRLAAPHRPGQVSLFENPAGATAAMSHGRGRYQRSPRADRRGDGVERTRPENQYAVASRANRRDAPPDSDRCREWIAEAAAGGTPSIPKRLDPLTPRKPYVPGEISRQVHHRAIREAAQHEAAHALMAESLGTGVKYASVTFTGAGETVYAALAKPEHQLMQALAGLACNAGCGHRVRGVEGEGGDLRRLCSTVEELTGDVCTEETVLDHQLVFYHRELVDAFLARKCVRCRRVGGLVGAACRRAGDG